MFGQAVRAWCDKSSKRILLIISGDQGHTHPWSNELPSIYQPAPSCFSIFPQAGTKEAELFDSYICDWITGAKTKSGNGLYRLDNHSLIEEAAKIEEYARSCGFSGILTMQGLMENEWIENQTDSSSTLLKSSADWLMTNFYYGRPTYYGMLSTLLVRNSL